MSEAPDVAGEVLGYRCWYVEARWQLEPPKLRSLNGAAWPHRAWLLAECRYGGVDECPHERHGGCGIHAAASRRELLVDFGYVDGTDVCVIGEVGLAGKVIPGEKGWRAQKARPVRLWVPYEQWPLANRLREAYGVPCGVTNVLKEGD